MSCKLPNNKPLPDFRGRQFGHDLEERITDYQFLGQK
jgi:hypothetical protein